MKKAFVKTYKVSQTFNAPLDFTFGWCTDFREDDAKMIGSSRRRHFLERTNERMVWVVTYKDKGKDKEGIRAVWLHPPNSWHLDTCGDHREVGEYKLVQLGKNKTRLDMVFRMTYDDKADVEGKKKWEKETLDEWNTYAKHLEKDYKAQSRQS